MTVKCLAGSVKDARVFFFFLVVTFADFLLLFDLETAFFLEVLFFVVFFLEVELFFEELFFCVLLFLAAATCTINTGSGVGLPAAVSPERNIVPANIDTIIPLTMCLLKLDPSEEEIFPELILYNDFKSIYLLDTIPSELTSLAPVFSVCDVAVHETVKNNSCNGLCKVTDKSSNWRPSNRVNIDIFLDINFY